MKEYRSAVVFIIILSAAVAGCGEKKKEEPLSGVITFTSGDVTVNNAKAGVGTRVTKESTVATGMKSIAVIQFSETAVITVRSGSVIRIEEIAGEKGVDALKLSQPSGSSFNKIVKKGADYQIRTPTIVASVRGTSFQLTSGEKTGGVKLLSGELSVAKVKDGKADPASAVKLTEGKKLEVTGEKVGAASEITREEVSELQVYDRIALVKGTADLEKGKISGEVVPAGVKSDLIKLESDDTGKAEEKRPPTLADLKKRYGALSVIRTKDGKEYIGAFTQKGAVMEVITVSGTISVNTANIQKISPYSQ